MIAIPYTSESCCHNLLVMISMVRGIFNVITDPIRTVSNLHTGNTVPVVNLSGDVLVSERGLVWFRLAAERDEPVLRVEH